MFSEGFFYFLIVAGLIWTLLGAITLLVLLFRDWKDGNLW